MFGIIIRTIITTAAREVTRESVRSVILSGTKKTPRNSFYRH